MVKSQESTKDSLEDEEKKEIEHTETAHSGGESDESSDDDDGEFYDPFNPSPSLRNEQWQSRKKNRNANDDDTGKHASIRESWLLMGAVEAMGNLMFALVHKVSHNLERSSGC
jgi:hypothetical protein